MWPVVWTAMRTYAPYVTFPVAFVVGAVGYHLEWFIRGTPKPREEEKGILELREERKLQEQVGKDSTQTCVCSFSPTGGCSGSKRGELEDKNHPLFHSPEYQFIA
ncbi:Small integral membrane protein 12 [Ameca splendens]|uniref:Small integral membrane protein 12 n=1 Tax=Ameca splendens TaxID=208324 RepID=A0ABV0Y7F7_9TELE